MDLKKVKDNKEEFKKKAIAAINVKTNACMGGQLPNEELNDIVETIFQSIFFLGEEEEV